MTPKKSSGFSVVEMMVAVAIIGILAGIAIPNLQKWMRKSRQKEMQMHLLDFYSLCKVHVAQWGGCQTNFVALGWNPEGDLSYRYRARPNPNGAPFNNSDMPNDITCFATDHNCNPSPGWPGKMWRELGGVCPPLAPKAFWGTPTFEMTTCGWLGGPVEDRWRIDETKAMTNDQDGL